MSRILDHGGHIGLQHDPLLCGAYALSPFLVVVDLVPMLIIKQGQVAVIKAYVGLATQDTSGSDFKYGSLVRPGHRGVWQEPLRTGKSIYRTRFSRRTWLPCSRIGESQIRRQKPSRKQKAAQDQRIEMEQATEK